MFSSLRCESVIHLNSIILYMSLLVMVHVGDVWCNNCTQEEYTDMQTLFSDCTGRVTSAYHVVEGESKESATCTLFTDLVEDCGKIWENCHSDGDIRRMKDMQLEALLGQYVASGLVQLKDCQYVQQYWGAEEAGGAAGTCTDREYIQSQTKFQSCSHAVSTQIYQTFQQVTEAARVAELVCDALNNISSSCPSLLQECFAPGDVRQMVRLHLQEIKGYLVNLSTVKLDNSSLDTCTALEKVKGEEYYEYDEEYEEGSSESSSDISSENNSEDNSAKLKELLMEHRSLEPSDDPGLSTQPSEEQEMKFTKEPDSKSAKLLEKSTKQQTIKTIQSSEMRSAGNVINCQNFIILISFLKLVQI
ncbi:uncharacterized protein LOC111704180 [Eurytemora carolleeae]|uniref:uncharacterized protein LOC111704180 n=1 Tax=Eurytemora carolleeae TaxID=1294199 RepID=UPI000C758DFE|nr:uncharacterized protein LOC111704180 [Eurytemora carolleeae]|eukprot:XP_023332100.1 uncharacterized protein LOC111704180 [Eurytemora affinis]